ncbi:nuclear factor 7, brain isoform X15 [Dicentrarchus labrax]|uniref:nuclear factor 7, brain isoform X13 n=1 Tax=Dicentrarchus labrax TaxID=13489 RepID=UPI0021F68B35|nr:nuclear factor 7, brain isoform X13 [Dicentrarchus labrax]XP_051258389.1 nuclear factor 7, brain isoform X14 [Dicentrarchus labrax]XP_051258390.1 nuclear factor 7, brain isoform X15 [Dicentrarchus labrax]
MSYQVCNCCGWSKATTYQGLRIHQGKNGCTPKGMRIPESEQYRMTNNFSKFTYMGPPIKVEEPFMSIFTPSIKSDRTNSDMSLQVCHCGWSKCTSYHGLRTHQGMMGCTPKGMRIPEDELYKWRDPWDKSHQEDSGPIYSTPLKKENEPMSPNLTTPMSPTAGVIEMMKSVLENQYSWQTTINSDRSLPALEFSTGAQQPVPMPVFQTLSTQANPAATEVKVKDTNQSLFGTPEHFHPTVTKARRALDFSSGAQQVGQLSWDLPTTTAEKERQKELEKERQKELEKEREKYLEKEREQEREKEREAQKLIKAKQDRIKADLQQKIQMTEQKISEVRSSVVASKGSLDIEWLEINSVFSEVIRVVEDIRQEALQPLEERRNRIKKESQDLVQTLQKEIDKLKKNIDELDKNPNLQVSPLTGLDNSRDWKNVTVDSSFSLGTLKSKTSKMMEQIQQKLDKLSSVELKRISTFAVDVKLDPATAHRCLVLSPDGKKVTDGGKNQAVFDSPKRFDMFGSILGLNGQTTGKSYWEVEVSNKTGWDLGVVRRNANRKGKISLTPDNGYWVTVHYEDDKYAALSAPPVSLSLTAKPQKVGVFLDYEEGLVSFYDVTAQSHIYSFTECLFTGEILPYFSPHLKQNGKNSDPLIISAVKKQK